MRLPLRLGSATAMTRCLRVGKIARCRCRAPSPRQAISADLLLHVFLVELAALLSFLVDGGDRGLDMRRHHLSSSCRCRRRAADHLHALLDLASRPCFSASSQALPKLSAAAGAGRLVDQRLEVGRQRIVLGRVHDERERRGRDARARSRTSRRCRGRSSAPPHAGTWRLRRCPWRARPAPRAAAPAAARRRAHRAGTCSARRRSGPSCP